MVRLAVVGVWIAVICAGHWLTQVYASTPGAAAEPPGRWPAETRLTRSTDGVTLLMFLHPQCPCSRASVTELDRLLARRGGGVHATAVFIQPAPFDEEWARSVLWRRASRIPGVRTVLDPDGIETRRFGAATSGEAMLFGATGELLYSGGITRARGHEGECAGRKALESWITGGRAALRRYPVFGCPLQHTHADCGDSPCCDFHDDPSS